MTWADWIPLLVAIAALVPQILTWLTNRKQSNADFANTIMEGGTKAVNAVTGLLDEYQEHNKELRQEIEDIKAARKKREAEHAAEIELLNKKITELDQMATQAINLRAENERLYRKDIEETKLLRDELEQLKGRLDSRSRVIQKLVQALKDRDIPLPDFNGDLTDSVKGWKWPGK